MCSRTVDRPGTQNDVRNSVLLSVLNDKLVLFQLSVGIRLGPLNRFILELARFVEQPSASDATVGINGKRTYVNESLYGTELDRCIKQVSCSDDTIHERPRKRLLGPRSQMKHHGHIPGCPGAVFTREKISGHHLHSSFWECGHNCIQLRQIAGRTHEAPQVSKTEAEQCLNDSCPDESVRARYQCQIVT